MEQLGGQLRVDSKVNVGSRFSFLIPFSTGSDSGSTSSIRSRTNSLGTRDEIESLVTALAGHHLTGSPRKSSSRGSRGSLSPRVMDMKAIESTVEPVLAKKSSQTKMKLLSQADGGEPLSLRILIVEVRVAYDFVFLY